MDKKLKIEVKHPRYNNEFFGYQNIEDYFLNILKKKKLTNAYLFNGIKGVGKATFAYRLARCILSRENKLESLDNLYTDKNENVFKEIINLINPDLTIIEPVSENKKINIDQLKALNKIVYGTALESDYKIIIIDSLDEFSSNKSYSSLLKLLEDCPINCIFIFISHSLYRIPDTIKSRCQKIYFKPISDDVLRKWFTNTPLIDKKEIDILVKLANGSLGRAIEIINNEEFFNIYTSAKKIINNITNLNKIEIEKFFSLFSNNILLEDFLLILQININNNIKEIINSKKINEVILKKKISLFFEINKKINNAKVFNLDTSQILSNIKYILIKNSENFNKV
tara:strand:- start:1219 stop:2238 length:1020 start_codon:yes stop_codon:yes gene_type:complete